MAGNKKHDNTVNKALSYALANMYPGAFASYRGQVFRVTGPSGGALAGIVPNLERTRQLDRELATDVGQALRQKLNVRLAKELTERGLPAVRLDRVNVLVPEKVDLRLDDPSLDYLYCTNAECGKMNTVSFIMKYRGRSGLQRCGACGSRMAQAPVWIPINKNRFRTPRALPVSGGAGGADLVRAMGFHQMMCPMLRYKRGGTDQCTHPQSTTKKCPHKFSEKIGSMKMTDPNRPIDSLRRFKPDCPEGLHVDGVEFERLYGTPEYYYKMDFPRESFTSSLRLSAVAEIPPRDGLVGELIEEVNTLLEEVKPAKFNPELVDLDATQFAEMRVLDVVYGYAVGSRRSGFYRFYIGTVNQEIPGRLTQTQGFMLRLGERFFSKLEALREEKPDTWGRKEVNELAEIALHSLKHALLMLAPLNTGFEPDKFHGSYDLDVDAREARVYVYDAEEGGNGGFASIIREPERFSKMLDDVVDRLQCRQRECRTACKQCLFIKNCGRVNLNLNRHLLNDLGIILGR